MEEYVVNKIDYNIPSIEIVDEKNNVSYTAIYTENADLLNYSGAKKFNSVVSISPVRKEESLYYIGDETPIISKMTFTDGDYELVFEKEMANSVGLFINNGVRMAVRYLQNITYDGRNVKQQLFARIHKNSYKNAEFDGTFDQLYIYGPQRFIKCDSTQDKYVYVRNNNVIYGINEFEQDGLCNCLRGICFESANIPASDYFPLNMYAQDYPLLSDNSVDSAMIFRGITAYIRNI